MITQELLDKHDDSSPIDWPSQSVTTNPYTCHVCGSDTHTWTIISERTRKTAGDGDIIQDECDAEHDTLTVTCTHCQTVLSQRPAYTAYCLVRDKLLHSKY